MNTPYQVNYDRDWTWIHFTDGKPADSVLACLHGKAHFSRRRNDWYVTELVQQSEIAAWFDGVNECPTMDAQPEPVTVTAPALQAPKVSKPAAAPKVTQNQADALRAWFEALDLSAIPEGESVTFEYYKNTVAIHHVDSTHKRIAAYYLFTRNPQQKQHRWTATTEARGDTKDELRAGFERYIDIIEGKIAKRDAQTAAKRIARESFVNPYKVGDVLYSSYGYDQTNINYYQVIRVTARSIEIREVYQEHSDHGHDSWRTTPRLNDFRGPAKLCPIYIDERGGYSISAPVNGHLRDWNGKPLFATTGH